jgi:hypothetical protein
MSFPLHFHIEEIRVIEYLPLKHLFAFRLPGAEARVQATIACVAQANDSVPDRVLELRSKHWCASLRMLTSSKRVPVRGVA